MTVSSAQFRTALRKFASGITVVTVAHEGQLHGMTASSFSSVSLEPPLVLVCLAKTSRTRDLVRLSGFFAVNILAADQGEIARAFARQGAKPFDGIPHRTGVHGTPLLDGTIAALQCRTVEMHEAGDHDVVVGEVDEATSASGAPLLYYDGAYRRVERAGSETRDPREI